MEFYMLSFFLDIDIFLRGNCSRDWIFFPFQKNDDLLRWRTAERDCDDDAGGLDFTPCAIISSVYKFKRSWAHFLPIVDLTEPKKMWEISWQGQASKKVGHLVVQ